MSPGPVPASYTHCLDIARVYIGVPTRSGAESPFFPALALGVEMTGPMCGSFPPDSGGVPVWCIRPSHFVAVAMSDRFRAISARGIDSRMFAVCTELADPQSTVDCGGPHRFELFAATHRVAVRRDLAGGARRRLPCDILTATGLAEVTAGGALTMEAVSYGFLEDGTMLEGRKSSGPTDTYAVCRIRPTDDQQRLTTSLRGIGSDRLPLR